MQECYTHELEKLVKASGLKPDLDAATAANPALAANWGTAKDWTEESRYQQKTQVETQTLYDALTDNANGVMTWIRQYW